MIEGKVEYDLDIGGGGSRQPISSFVDDGGRMMVDEPAKPLAMTFCNGTTGDGPIRSSSSTATLMNGGGGGMDGLGVGGMHTQQLNALLQAGMAQHQQQQPGPSLLIGTANGTNRGGTPMSAGIMGGGQHSGGASSSSCGGSGGGGKSQPRQRRKVPEGELCAVCLDRATGYHYGVASCNGCKTFFRRTIVSDHTFVCQYNGNCDVNKNVRCACRHCRFEKCKAVGMDARAIQNDRDRIGPTKKMRLSSGDCINGKRDSVDEDQLSLASMSPQARLVDDRLLEHVINIENLCNQLRNCCMEESKGVHETLAQPSMLFQVHNLPKDVNTMYKELYPASMNDIQMWNIRELRLSLEWAKTFEEFRKLSNSDQFALVRNFAFTFNILNRVYYSLDYGPDKIVYPNGAFILRQPQDSVKIPGCRSIYHRQMDEIMIPFRKMKVDMREFALFKAVIFFNPDACELSQEVREHINQERMKYLTILHHIIVERHGTFAGVNKYGTLLMMASSIQNIMDQNEENMQVMEVFGHFWRINAFVKELCMK